MAFQGYEDGVMRCDRTSFVIDENGKKLNRGDSCSPHEAINIY